MFKKIQEIVSVILGLRKFIVMLALILIAVIFRVKNLVNGSEMVDLLKATAIAFMASNSVEHLKTMVTSYVDALSGKKVVEEDSSVGDDSDAK